jgi:hypothetical protein
VCLIGSAKIRRFPWRRYSVTQPSQSSKIFAHLARIPEQYAIDSNANHEKKMLIFS